jgi:2-C-methyl-D-erythritol 2,4-cyclodiphosphate synthase
MRIGQGIDVHAFTHGDHLVLGGVRIPFDKAFEAHSDGDVVIHALCDALLGAAGLGDIGHHFPDSDPGYKGVESRILLREVLVKIQCAGWKCVNIDATVIAQMPKISPYLLQMRTNVANDLQIDISAVNIKATTTEWLGFAGRGEGIAASVVALLESSQ